MNKKLLFLIIISFLPVFSMQLKNTSQEKKKQVVEDSIQKQAEMIKEQLAVMHKTNPEATELHAAGYLGYLEWIRTWVELNRDDPNFKVKLKKWDSFMMSARQMASLRNKLDVAKYLFDLEK